MPTLTWTGKEKVINHHQEVPFRVLEHRYGFNASTGQTNQETGSGNKIIHGDNLLALKTLLPEYEGRIKCIYIDPPYNTGNEGWVYNDNVNDPKIKKWLGEVVGKEGEDLNRHDKWLCMMYPRLKILHKLLSEDGVIFVSIDDNELYGLKYLLDEIFGVSNRLETFIWRTDGNFDNQAKTKTCHEYIITYCKKLAIFKHPEAVDPNIRSNSKLNKPIIRNTIVKNGPKNPISSVTLPIGFPADFESGIIKARNDMYPFYENDAIVENFCLKNVVIVKSGWSSKNLLEEFINNDFKSVLDTKAQLTNFVLTKTGAIESVKTREKKSHVVSVLTNMGSTQNMSNELSAMGIKFDYPKPVYLIQYLLSFISSKDHFILDSFAGSGTTAHAVLNLNKQDGGNRKFILVEMEDYAETITAERVRRVMKGYNSTEGTGGEFDYYELGQPLFSAEGELNEDIPVEKIRNYVFYTETKTPLFKKTDSNNPYFLEKWNDTGYYFYYEKDRITTLDLDFLATIDVTAEQHLIYADQCLLDKDFLANNQIIFKKIPRDITRF